MRWFLGTGLKPRSASDANASTTATTEADPYGMTTKGTSNSKSNGKSNDISNSKSNGNGKNKGEIQGFFASLRMTAVGEVE